MHFQQRPEFLTNLVHMKLYHDRNWMLKFTVTFPLGVFVRFMMNQKIINSMMPRLYSAIALGLTENIQVTYKLFCLIKGEILK